METMEVQVQRSFVIPSGETEGGPSEEVPLTVFDLFAPPYYITVLYAFSPPNPTNDALIAALSATLPYFPILTARLSRSPGSPHRPFFITGSGGAGALVVEAAVSSKLSDHLPLEPSPELEILYQPTKDTQHMLQVQINRLACGGLVIASSSHHQAADGYSMNTFLHAWANAVRGTPQLGRPIPYGPGALVPRSPPQCEFEHRGAEFLPLLPYQKDAISQTLDIDPSEVTNILLHYTAELVAKLKGSVQNKYTTFETLSAHIWKKITVARGLSGAVRSAIHVSVNGRGRLGLGTVPEVFFGNVVLKASAKARASELVSGSLADAAARMRAGIRAVDQRYFQSFVDFGALHGDEEMVPVHADEGYTVSPNVKSDSWLHLKLHRLDFGCGGRLAGIVPVKVPQDGIVFLVPSLREGGGVEVFVALKEKHARELTRIAYALG